MCRKKPGPVRRRVRKTIAFLLSLLILFTAYFELVVKAQLRDVIIRGMQTLSEQSVNQAVEEYLSEHADIGEKLCDIVYDSGCVAAISLNASSVNAVKTAITARAQSIIDDESRTQGVSVKLGNFSGIVFLSNVGPDIHFTVDSTQTVSCEFNSSFESAGINQTIHHITITVTVDLLIYSPFHIGETVTTSSTYEIAQTVIVGTVPSYGGVVTY